MFDPRKLIPLSIEDCSAPMAVITEITEKTPIVMPIIVSAARSLFAPRDASAILMISLNNILKSETPNPKSERNFEFAYSYLSAATGSRREADQAGAKPENKPVRIETAILTRTRPSENWIGKEGNACPMPVHITYAKPNPMNPPSRHSEVDSIRN